MEGIRVTDVRIVKSDSSFLVDDGKTAVLFDSGFGFTGFRTAEKIKSVLGERKLDYIFLSHSHYDHALGSPYILRYYPDAKVVAGEYAAEIFKRDGAKRLMKELDSAFARECGVTDYEFLGDELRVDIPVRDGDTIYAGDMNFEVLELPGHTNCSIGFFCKEKKLLLSSETLGVYDGKELILPAYLVSVEKTISSIERVLKLDIDYILAPHFGILSKEQTDFFLRNMKDASLNTAEDIKQRLLNKETSEEIFEVYKDKYWRGYFREIYPVEAMKLNTSIMIKLVASELIK